MALAEKFHHTSRGSEDCQGQEREENELNFAMCQMTPPPELQPPSTSRSLLRRLGATPEQVIAVPKISEDSIPQRTVLREPQMVEQLVEVPTDVVVVAQLVEQTVDIPVVGARGVPGYGGPQGFLPAQVFFLLTSRTLTFQSQGVGFLAMEVFKVLTQDKVRSVLFSRSLPFLFPVKVLKVFSLILVRQLLPQFFFFIFPVRKKCGGRRELECEGARALELIRAERS